MATAVGNGTIVLSKIPLEIMGLWGARPVTVSVYSRGGIPGQMAGYVSIAFKCNALK